MHHLPARPLKMVPPSFLSTCWHTENPRATLSHSHSVIHSPGPKAPLEALWLSRKLDQFHLQLCVVSAHRGRRPDIWTDAALVIAKETTQHTIRGTYCKLGQISATHYGPHALWHVWSHQWLLKELEDTFGGNSMQYLLVERKQTEIPQVFSTLAFLVKTFTILNIYPKICLIF